MTTLSDFYLLDTNILVHFVRDDRLGQYINAKYALLMVEPRPLVSIVTVGELGSLAEQLQWGRAKTDQASFLPPKTQQFRWIYPKPAAANIPVYGSGRGWLELFPPCQR
jgi:hypothetical protein